MGNFDSFQSAAVNISSGIMGLQDEVVNIVAAGPTSRGI